MQTIRNGAQMYRDSPRVQKDATDLIRQFPTLLPKTEYLQIKNANPVLVLVFHGTIPVQYKGSTYNIPISMHVPPAYPAQPPMVSVVPTAQMVLRPSVNVDASGQFTHLSVGRGWKPFGNLSSVVGVMQNVFGQEPPVYSKSSSQSSMASSYQSQQSYPTAQSPSYQPVSSPYQASSSYASPTYPVPQYQPQYQQQYQYEKMDMPQPMSLPQNLPSQLNSAQQLPSYSISHGRQSDPYFTPLSMPDVSLSKPAYKDEDDDAVVLLSLRSALEDKVSRTMQDFDSKLDTKMLSKLPGFDTSLSEMDRLLELNQRLQDAVDRNSKDAALLDAAIQQAQKKLKELDEYLEHQSKDDNELMPIIPCSNQSQQSTVKVATQLMDALCEEASLEDVMYELQRQFIAGQLTDVDVYLKQIRKLANEQYMARLLIRRIKSACQVL